MQFVSNIFECTNSFVSFLFINFMWSVHVREEFNRIPRNLVFWTLTIACPSNTSLVGLITFYFLLKYHEVRFLMFNESLVNLDHRDNLTSSRFTIEHIPSKLLPEKTGWCHRQTLSY